MITSEQELTGVLNNEIIETGGGKYAPRHILFRGYTGDELTEEINNLDTSKITSMKYMFSECSALSSLDLSGFNTSSVTDMASMFNKCGSLKSLDLSSFDTSNVTDMSTMFTECSNIETINVSTFNTPCVTSLASMFSYCDNLKSLDLSSFDTSNVTYMSNMFFRCYELEHVDLSSFDTSNVTAMFNMFNGFQSLTELDISNFDMSKVNDIEDMFNAGNSNRTLQHLSFGTNLGKGFTRTSANYSRYALNVSNILELPHDSLMSIINNLYDLNLSYDVANGGRLYTQSLILGSTNMAKLTADEIAIATAKGWSVS